MVRGARRAGPSRARVHHLHRPADEDVVDPRRRRDRGERRSPRRPRLRSMRRGAIAAMPADRPRRRAWRSGRPPTTTGPPVERRARGPHELVRLRATLRRRRARDASRPRRRRRTAADRPSDQGAARVPAGALARNRTSRRPATATDRPSSTAFFTRRRNGDHGSRAARIPTSRRTDAGRGATRSPGAAARRGASRCTTAATRSRPSRNPRTL